VAGRCARGIDDGMEFGAGEGGEGPVPAECEFRHVCLVSA
jgi:hypothetical protein